MSTTGGPGGSGTCVGVGTEPLPGAPTTLSEPFAFLPHAHTVPSSLSASAPSEPVAMSMTPLPGPKPVTCFGTYWSFAVTGRPAYGGPAPHEGTVPSFCRIRVNWLPDETCRTLPPASDSGTGYGSIRIAVPPSQRICPQARTVPSFMTA